MKMPAKFSPTLADSCPHSLLGPQFRLTWQKLQFATKSGACDTITPKSTVALLGRCGRGPGPARIAPYRCPCERLDETPSYVWEPLMSQLSMPKPDPAIVSRRAEIVRQLKKLVPDVVLIADQEGRRTFETDALTAYRCLPLLVALPGTTEEVSKILRFCHDNHIKVVPRGAGTSLSGGALPLEDSIVLCLSRMNKVLSIDLPNRVA